MGLDKKIIFAKARRCGMTKVYHVYLVQQYWIEKYGLETYRAILLELKKEHDQNSEDEQEYN